MLEKVFKQHQDWLNIAKSLLNSKEDAEDIVQELYITLHRYNIEEVKIKYNDEINRGFIYIVLKNLIKNFIRYNTFQKRDVRLNVNIENVNHIPDQEIKDDIFERIQDEIDTWNHYDKNLFQLYMYSGLSLREISNGSDKKIDKFIDKSFKMHPESIKRGTGISVTSIFHTIKLCKERIKLNVSYKL